MAFFAQVCTTGQDLDEAGTQLAARKAELRTNYEDSAAPKLELAGWPPRGCH